MLRRKFAGWRALLPALPGLALTERVVLLVLVLTERRRTTLERLATEAGLAEVRVSVLARLTELVRTGYPFEVSARDVRAERTVFRRAARENVADPPPRAAAFRRATG